MQSMAAGAVEQTALERRPDVTEARLAERVIAVARALLAMVAVLLLSLDPLEPLAYAKLTSVLLLVYLGFAIVLLVFLIRAKTIPRYLPMFLQAIDVAFATVLTL